MNIAACLALLPLVAPRLQDARPEGAVFDSGIVSVKTPGHAVDIDVDLKGARTVYLVVPDAGDGILCDFANWAEPRFVGPDGQTRLVDLEWESAWTDNGKVSTERNCEGGPMTIRGRKVAYGIGSHANSVIVYDVPKGATRFEARAGIDSQGPDEGIGGATVRFLVFTREPKMRLRRRRREPEEREDEASPALPTSIKTLPGFKVERIYSVPRSQGSWVSLTVDDRGRLIASPQFQRGLYRITLGAGGPRVERLEVELGWAHGLLFAFDSLYVVVAEGGKRHGLYRLQDTDGDDRFDRTTLLLPLQGGGEHGPHGVVVGPKGKSLYLVCGNATRLAEAIDASRAPRNWRVDQLIPPVGESSGSGRAGPEGWIVRLGPDGSNPELICNGLRNSYDIAFDRRGDLFTFDSDMEPEMGTPWYRPTRVCFVTSGAEFGWRGGPRNWAPYFADGLEGILDIGPASPTGVLFGTGAKFPAKYQDAFFALDWTFGTIHAIHVAAEGAAYAATREDFVTGAPLPVTDAVIGGDGAMYFAVGGRRIQSALYRVTYEGPEPVSASRKSIDAKAARLHALRRRLEAYHGGEDPGAVDAAWPHLGHPDRFIRFAARIAVENQPVATWTHRAFAEKGSLARIHALIALARHGGRDLRPRIVRALSDLDFPSLSVLERTDLLRAYAIVCSRMGKPGREERAQVLAQLNGRYPGKVGVVNRELARVLLYLEAPEAVNRTLTLMEAAKPGAVADLWALAGRNRQYGRPIESMMRMKPQEERMYYASLLRRARAGWTSERRRRYFRWMGDAIRESRGGNAYRGSWERIRGEALDRAPGEMRDELAGLSSGALPSVPRVEDLPKPKGPGKAWTVNALREKIRDGALASRNFENGKWMYSAASCVVCHRFGGEGGAVGPDLTTLMNRFTPRDVVEAVVEPSRVVPDQYRNIAVKLRNGNVIVGKVVDEDDLRIRIMTDMTRPRDLTVVQRSELAVRKVSETSLMPAKLLDRLNEDEVLDLLAYLLSRGNPDHRYFK